ncbi:MAG: hypothetical protein RIB32_03110 [Phycisphaerales bacterium]
MNQDRIIQLACVAVLALCLIASSVLSTNITVEASRAQLSYADTYQEGDPPEVALGIAMGAFRGLFVNYLWIRATKLKEEGKFYEAIELSEAITRLQPRFPRVWSFHAWNMSYNISVATNTASERWQWVSAGVDLLRKEGIPRNPNDVLLHKELAWIFLHKIQGYTDDANRYYKRQMAKEWTFVLGPPPRPADDVEWTYEQARDAYARKLEFIVAMPDSIDEMIESEYRLQEERGVPEADQTSRIQEVVDRIRNDAGLDLDVDLLRFVETYMAYVTSPLREEYELGLRNSQYNEVIAELLFDDRLAEPFAYVLAHTRKRILIDEYNMEPERMLVYTQKYGPLDWRHPATHALYWSATGVDEGLERKNATRFDTLNTDRVTIHAIQELFRTGDIQFNLLTDSYSALYNLYFVDVYGDILNNELRGRGDDPESRKVFTLYGAGYQNFMVATIRVYFRMGEFEKAGEYLSKLRNWEGRNFNDPAFVQLLNEPLEVFVEQTTDASEYTRPSVALQEITVALRDAFTRGLLKKRNEDLYEAQFNYAKEVHESYFQYHDLNTSVDAREDRMDIIPRDFDEVVRIVFTQLVQTGELDQWEASRVYRKLGMQLQRMAYDGVVPFFARRTGGDPELVERLFPQPPGLAAYRAQKQREFEESTKGRVDELNKVQQ